jgi:predicted RNA methylase
MSTPAYLPGMENEQRLRSLSQFYTPPDLAARLWGWCEALSRKHVPFRVLEPSAGDGALVRPMLVGPRRLDEVVMYEIDPARGPALLDLCTRSEAVDVSYRPLDFLSDNTPGVFDLCVMNPPYERDQDAEFILRSLEVSAVTVGLFRSAFLHGQGRWSRLWRFTDVQRIAWLSGRPDFGGDHSAKADFVAMHLTRRTHARKQGEPMACNVEWW